MGDTMKLVVKHFNELTAKELWAIYQVRCDVFVVEQECIYQDVDAHDLVAYHLWMEDKEGIQAYARVIPAGTVFSEVSLGRVLTKKRGMGLGTKIVQAAMDIAVSEFNATEITIEAQTYVKKMYENLGFVVTSDEFIEDGIPHVKMRWKKDLPEQM